VEREGEGNVEYLGIRREGCLEERPDLLPSPTNLQPAATPAARQCLLTELPASVDILIGRASCASSVLSQFSWSASMVE